MPEPACRHGGTPPAAHTPAVRRGRNVVQVVGIREYAHWHRLDNARKDAEGIRTLFVDRLGFIEVADPMYDAQATKAAIESLVQETLLKLEPDDSLVFFFAGHGHTEKHQVGAKTVKTGYLIPAEAERPEALKFSEYVKLDSLLADMEKLPARHVLLILDACFSGLALSETLDVPRSDERYSDDLSQRVSRRLIASAMEEQTARDSGPIEGHSPFTGFLVRGLDSGAADRGPKGFVTGSELGLYVQQEVGRWADSKQTADFGAFGRLDERGELVIPLRGETYNVRQAQDSLAAADSIYVIGRAAGDAKRFASAARQYRQAIRHADLAKRSLPMAELGLAKALLGARDTDGAVSVLQALTDREQERAPADALLWLGMALAKRQEYAPAADCLETWCGKYPKHVDAAWAGEYCTWLRNAQQHPRGRLRALVIGINQYKLATARKLSGAVNDALCLFARVLVEHCGFQSEDVQVLIDDQAARANVQAAIEELQDCEPDDTVVVFFSGHAVPSSQPDVFGRNDHKHVYLLMHDTTNQPGYLTNGVSADELHRWLQGIPASQKLLVLDTHADEHLVKLAQEEGSYDLILASDTAETTYEWWTKLDGEKVPCGVLTAALYRSLLDNDPKTVTFGTLMTGAIRFAHEVTSDSERFSRPQTPFFEGVLNRRVFGVEDLFLAAFELSEYGLHSARTAGQLAKSYRRFCQNIAANHPRAHAAFGCGLLALGAVPEATDTLETAVHQAGDEGWKARLALCRAYVHVGRYGDAYQVLQPCLLSAPEEARIRMEVLSRLLETLQGSRRYALLVDTQAAPSPSSGSPAGGGADDLAALRSVLVQRWGFDAADVIELRGEGAAKEAVLEQCRHVVAVSGTELALLYYRGDVIDTGGTDWCADRRKQENLSLGGLLVSELRALGAGLENLLIIIDPAELMR